MGLVKLDSKAHRETAELVNIGFLWSMVRRKSGSGEFLVEFEREYIVGRGCERHGLIYREGFLRHRKEKLGELFRKYKKTTLQSLAEIQLLLSWRNNLPMSGEETGALKLC